MTPDKWTINASNCFERPLGDSEYSYYPPSRDGVGDMFLHIAFRAPKDRLRPERVVNAWAVLRNRHPLLACQVIEENGSVRFSFLPPGTVQESLKEAQDALFFRRESKDDLWLKWMPSYQISVAVFQTNADNHFRIIEQTIYQYGNGGSWSMVDGRHVLRMNDSGTSGTLRFLGDNGEIFIVALGVHNQKRWGDIVSNLQQNQTGVLIHPQYYSDQHKDREEQREKQLASYSVKNAHGRQLSIKYTQAEGQNLAANIIIG
ncbi:hypothetical protein H0H93_006092 [Arthromyces matolae]|nr:hypothetical protein H0H93_006092 [Arthromyces matolae]